MNGDGIADLVLGASGVNSGISYVIFGTRNGFPASFNLNTLNGSNGFTIPGIAASGFLGWSVSSAGDINGDNISDLVLGASGTNFTNVGVSYVLFGSRGGFPAVFNLTNLNGSNGFMIPGIVAGGWSVSSAGDINGDNISDLVLGAPHTGTGTSYVLFGTRSGFPSLFNLSNLNGSNGFVVPGIGIAAFGWLGASVASSGDINDDGIGDLVLGAPEANYVSFVGAYGVSYVIFGSHYAFPASFNLTNLNGSNGFIIPGITAGGELGWSVSTAGDLNGDGISDLVLGARNANLGNGASYVIFGGLSSINIIKNELIIIEGQTVQLNKTNLDAAGLVLFDSLTFIAIQVQGGRFTFVNNSAISIFNFTRTQINTNQIQFISDRSNVVTYQIGIMNITSGQLVFKPIPADVNFTNYPPVVVSQSTTHTITVEEPFSFTLQADQVFNDVDGDPLRYSASSNGAVLPNWLSFDASQSNQLTFRGKAPTEGVTPISLTAKDPINASVVTQFDIAAIPPNGNGTNFRNEINTTEIVGSVLGGLAGLAMLAGGIFGLWSYGRNKTSRSSEYFADEVRNALNLKNVDNFGSDEGQKFVSVVHRLEKTLHQLGIDTVTMRPLELRQLAYDVAVAASNKISSATDCIGRSVITVTDLNDNLQNLVNEVQILRAGGQKYMV